MNILFVNLSDKAEKLYPVNWPDTNELNNKYFAFNLQTAKRVLTENHIEMMSLSVKSKADEDLLNYVQHYYPELKVLVVKQEGEQEHISLFQHGYYVSLGGTLSLKTEKVRI